jgi:hypothetical protein
MNRTSSRFSRWIHLSSCGIGGVVLALGAAGCSSSGTGSTAGPGAGSADISGSYAGNITNGASSCPGNWQVGASAQVSAVAVQSGGNVSLDVTGAAGVIVQAALGSSTFNGTVSGDDVSATLHGTTSQTDGNCTYTWAATFAGTLSGDTLSGTITYAPVTNGGSDCTAHQITTCSEVQSFDGVRPTTAPTGVDGGTTVDGG